ncbi:MAG: glycosyl transferase family 1 [Porticoccaceae bacterium]|nr:glycosyl transferase family 1 [Porticoccaceae bacterium]
MKLLVITTLYPNKVQYRHGIFVETRLRHLLASGRVDATVIAPVPWFPFRLGKGSRYVSSRDIPRIEQRDGIRIYHPRYCAIPKIGMLLTPFFLALSIGLQVRRLKKAGITWDIVDSHYYYPDGVAVALTARSLDAPFTVTARGTDINLIPRYSLPRNLILWAAEKASASITVCSALRDELVGLGAEGDKIQVWRNGVDLTLFRPMDRAKCRQRYKMTGKTLVSVGHLIERKGHHLVIAAMSQLPDCELLIVGDGEEQRNLEHLVEKLGLCDRVRFLGAVEQSELAEIYSGADVLVLGSSREGWANVLLEAMACGTPVAATEIWGTPEVVQSREAGLLIPERTPESIAETVKQLFVDYPDRAGTRRYAEKFSWDATTDGLLHLFREIAGGGALHRAGRTT